MTQRAGIDWPFVRRGGLLGATIVIFALGNLNVVQFYLFPSHERIWLDAHIYFQATQAWVGGADPWDVSWQGVPFAAPPTALLLNLPLLPFGENFAVGFWVVANGLSLAYLLWRLGLPIWWVLFHPIVEGFLGATPDITLAALILAGGGAIAAVTKPYSVPSILAEGRLKAIALAILIGLVTLPWLPWATFLDAVPQIRQAFEDHTLVVSAFGSPVLMVLTGIALLSLGRRRGLMLTTPGLLAQQPHYLVFSLGVIATSPMLYLPMALNVGHIASFAIIVYAAYWKVQAMDLFRGGAVSAPTQELT